LGEIVSGFFLTVDEVVELTARKNYMCQCRQLKMQGIPFTQDAAGRPKVVREVLTYQSQKITAHASPNAAALVKLTRGKH
jgi:hypothetical protein